jgi:hypothetical protein
MAEEENLGVLNTVRERRRREPFIPFRLVMSSGETYTVENADLLAIGQSQLIYCVPHSDRVIYLRLNQLATVEDLGARPGNKRR